ncbi:MCE family protein [Nocardia miyunensis]|uniref:MCE family protein n=1 Tax=Nocardia miyunensis TaxID=282684 RepID=UPI00082C19F1|nr:MCE family protein [Nocardia miyunensis]
MNLLRKMSRVPRWVRYVAAALVVALAGWIVYSAVTNIGKTHITAYFPSTNAIYAGDNVEILGVKVGRINSIEPGKDNVKVTMTVDRGVDIPADARAVIISPSLVSARFVQLAPAYDGGPKMHDNAVIPIQRTAVPVEWDDIKTQLTRLSKALGPEGNDPKGSFGRFVDTASANLGNGNAQSLRDTLKELSSTFNTLSDSRTDLFGTIRNLQQLVDVLSKSNEQIVQFGGRLASVSSVLAGVSTDLGAGLDNLSSAIDDVKRFLDERGGALTEGVQRLSDVTKTVADKRGQLANLLHAAPNGLVNFYQIYKPAQGSLAGAITYSNFANPIEFLCGSVEGIGADESEKSGQLCRQYLAPVVNSLLMNYPPLLVNPASTQTAFPSQLRFSTPELAQQAAREGIPVSVPKGVSGLALPGGGR